MSSKLSVDGRRRTYPVDQVSTFFECPDLVRTSGATYPNEPATENSCSPEACKCFALEHQSEYIAMIVNMVKMTYMPKSAMTISDSGSLVR